MAWQTGEWDKAIGPAGTQIRIDNPGPLLPIDKEGPGFCSCDPTTFRAGVMYSGPGESITLHGCGLSPEWFTLAGDSVFTPIVEFGIAEHYEFERLARRKTIGGSDMV